MACSPRRQTGSDVKPVSSLSSPGVALLGQSVGGFMRTGVRGANKQPERSEMETNRPPRASCCDPRRQSSTIRRWDSLYLCQSESLDSDVFLHPSDRGSANSPASRTLDSASLLQPLSTQSQSHRRLTKSEIRYKRHKAGDDFQRLEGSSPSEQMQKTTWDIVVARFTLVGSCCKGLV